MNTFCFEPEKLIKNRFYLPFLDNLSYCGLKINLCELTQDLDKTNLLITSHLDNIVSNLKNNKIIELRSYNNQKTLCINPDSDISDDIYTIDYRLSNNPSCLGALGITTFFNLPDDSFDRIIFNIKSNDNQKFLLNSFCFSEIRRLLKINGSLIINTNEKQFICNPFNIPSKLILDEL